MYRLIFLLLILLVSCKSRETRMNEVFALKEMSELATVEYTVTKIVKANDDKTWYKLGDRKILMSCSARIKAGIDLSVITERSIPAFILAEQLISIFLSPSLYQVLSSFAFTIFVTVYSTVASSLISFRANTSFILVSRDLQETNRMSNKNISRYMRQFIDYFSENCA